MFLALMIAGGILIATVFVVAIPQLGQDVEQTEAELHEPGARTVAFEVPPGRTRPS